MTSDPNDLQAIAQKLLSGDFDINQLDRIVSTGTEN